MASALKSSAAVVATILTALWARSVASAAEPDDLPVLPPPEAIVVFDGKGTNLFVSATGDASNWSVEDGALVSTPNTRRSNNLVSRLHFLDAEIHVEFMLPPTGDGNSGIYIHGLYELQILNSAAKKEPEAGDMGGVYGLYKPLVNAARGPGVWQSYDVRYHAPRRDAAGKILADGMITAWLNGHMVHDRVKVGAKTSDYNPYRYDTTPYLKTISNRQQRTMFGPLILQDHDNPVRFRNIWVKPLDDQAFVYDPAAGERSRSGDERVPPNP